MNSSLTVASVAILLMLTVSVAPVSASDEETPVSAPILTVRSSSESLARPKVLPALYASYAVLQAYDVYSTKQGLARGGREANPLMTGVVGSTSAFIAMKAVVGAGTVVAAERLWKTNKPAAIAVMVAANGVAAIVAARNARTLGQIR